MNYKIYDIVIGLLKKRLPYLKTEQYKDVLFGDDGINIDSLSFLLLLLDIENAFNIIIDDDYWSIRKLDGVYAIVEYLESTVECKGIENDC